MTASAWGGGGGWSIIYRYQRTKYIMGKYKFHFQDKIFNTLNNIACPSQEVKTVRHHLMHCVATPETWNIMWIGLEVLLTTVVTNWILNILHHRDMTKSKLFVAVYFISKGLQVCQVIMWGHTWRKSKCGIWLGFDKLRKTSSDETLFCEKVWNHAEVYSSALKNLHLICMNLCNITLWVMYYLLVLDMKQMTSCRMGVEWTGLDGDISYYNLIICFLNAKYSIWRRWVKTIQRKTYVEMSIV